MKNEGIELDLLTPQNEPLNPWNEPSMVMLAREQALFVGKYLGPELERQRLKTKIVCWDHNCNAPEYPLTVLKDPRARQHTAGVGWHLYEGTIDALTRVHDAYPEKKTYFTEQWVGAGAPSMATWAGTPRRSSSDPRATGRAGSWGGTSRATPNMDRTRRGLCDERRRADHRRPAGLAQRLVLRDGTCREVRPQGSCAWPRARRTGCRTWPSGRPPGRWS